MILLRIACMERAVSDPQTEEFIRAIREFINPESDAHLCISNATLTVTGMEAFADAWDRQAARESEWSARIKIRQGAPSSHAPSFAESENSVSKSNWLARRGQGSG
jgi:hypothetical protein